MEDSPVLSVVVATYNRLAELQAMLDSLLPQTVGQPVEIVIVDDRSTDETWAWLGTTFANSPTITSLRMEKNSGPGPARNLGLSVARGRYFLPIDSDFLVTEDAIGRILRAIREEPRYPLLFFPCLRYPAMCRLDSRKGRSEITYSSFLTEEVGELIPVADLEYLRVRGLAYPNLRAGGESLLWAGILAHGPALFIDSPVVLYRTDVAQRICTLEYQMKHPADLAEVSDALATLFSGEFPLSVRQARAQKYLAAGTYYLLAGNFAVGRKRLISAAAEGCWSAVPTLAASFGGHRLFRALFRFYRTKLKHAYL